MAKKKIKKKKKLRTLPKMKRDLHVLWSKTVRGAVDFRCVICGIASGTIYLNKKGDEVKCKIDAHHIVVKEIKNLFLHFDPMDGISVCPTCHKWGNNSFHRNPVFTMDWLQRNDFKKWEYILANHTVRIDLDNRKVLEEIEDRLKNGLPLDLERIRDVEAKFPRKTKSANKLEGNILDAFSNEDDIHTNSSSSSSQD